jgi:hypothetical protein
MKTERPKEPEKTKKEEEYHGIFATRPTPPKEPPQPRCACDPFEAILDAYAENPERWDGLE